MFPSRSSRENPYLRGERNPYPLLAVVWFDRVVVPVTTLPPQPVFYTDEFIGSMHSTEAKYARETPLGTNNSRV